MSIEKTAQPDENGRSLNQGTNQPETPPKKRRGTRRAKTGSSPTPERGVDIKRSPKPDNRDEEKVERLAAPDWRSEQPLPSARNSIDPRGENTPPELFEDKD